MRRNPVLLATLLTAALVAAAASCGVSTEDSARASGRSPSGSKGGAAGASAGVPNEWWTILDEQFAATEDKASTVPTVDMDGRCQLGDALEVAGDKVGQFGSGASAFAGSGRRYICQFSDPVSVDVIVGRFTEGADYDELTATLPEDGFRDVDVAGATFAVKKTEAGNGAHTDFSVTHLAKERHGFVTLTLELTDDAQRASFTEEQAAQVLARFMKG